MTKAALIILILIGAASGSQLVSGRIGAKNCTGTGGCCKIDEGDCDSNDDCCSGLKCNYDWGFQTDLCEAGPTTKDFSWGTWTEWSACSISCGMIGVRSRSRDCESGPIDGGRECPKMTDKQWESCGEPCWTDYTDWSPCRGLICGELGKQSRNRTCIEPEAVEYYAGNGKPCPENLVQVQRRDFDTIGLLFG